MGNILLRSKQYAKALKMYRMSLDQIPEQNADLKFEHLPCLSFQKQIELIVDLKFEKTSQQLIYS